jgi:hypothetical protein
LCYIDENYPKERQIKNISIFNQEKIKNIFEKDECFKLNKKSSKLISTKIQKNGSSAKQKE